MAIGLQIRADSAVGIFDAGGGGGDLVHGAAFTVTGSGFGTRPNYNVDGYTWQGASFLHFRYADFAGGEGSTTKASWLTATKGFFPAYTDGFTTDWLDRGIRVVDGGPSQSGKYIRRTYNGAVFSPRLGGMWCDVTGASDAIAYYAFQFRIPINPNLASSKWIRQYYDSTRDWFATAGSNGFHITPYMDGFTRYPPGGSNWDTPSYWTSWRSVEFVVQGATSKMIIDGTEYSGSNSNVNGGAFSTDIPLISTDSVPNGHSLEFPGMIDDDGTSGASFEHADIYVDFTRARVVARQGTIRVAQCLTAWADGSISGRFNKCGLSSGAAFLDVYNSSGTLVTSQSVTVA